MPIQCKSYAGKLGWICRKRMPALTGEAYLHLQYFMRAHLTKRYIKWFMSSQTVPQPLLVSLETINRCNSACAFCPANKAHDKRKFRKMDEALFYKIIGELQSWNYQGYISLYVNNEPLMDHRIVGFTKYAKRNLPKAKILMFTNGTLFTLEKFKKLAAYVDVMIINNYSYTLALHPPVEEIYRYVMSYPEKFLNIDIKIQQRYLNEILTNRAGSSPNKSVKQRVVRQRCLLPFTDLTVYPSGQVGLCCSDAQERTNLGNLNAHTVQEIWNGAVLRSIREKIKDGRHGYSFCKGCDFVDAGIRIETIRSILKG